MKTQWRLHSDFDTVHEQANNEADVTGAVDLDVRHILAGLAYIHHSRAMQILSGLGINHNRLRDYLNDTGKSCFTHIETREYSSEVKSAFELAKVEAAKHSKDTIVGTEDLLVALCRDPNGTMAAILKDFGLTTDAVIGAFYALIQRPVSSPAVSYDQLVLSFTGDELVAANSKAPESHKKRNGTQKHHGSGKKKKKKH